MRAVALTADAAKVLSASMDGTVRVWDTRTGACLHVLSGHTDKVYAVAPAPDGRLALSGAKDHTLRLWDLATGQCRRVLEGHEDVVRAVAFLPDGRFAISAAKTRRFACGRSRTGRSAAVEHVSGSVLALAVSADGRRAAAGTYDRKVLAWDPRLGSNGLIREER